jgi:hypothetical protein
MVVLLVRVTGNGMVVLGDAEASASWTKALQLQRPTVDRPVTGPATVTVGFVKRSHALLSDERQQKQQLARRVMGPRKSRWL